MKPNFWGTTLLYTAALNNQLDIVKYLVDKARCEVNARNWRDANSDGSPAASETRNPVFGSTALHGACANNHLPIVEYLVAEKSADYFIKNQVNKTPIDYAEQHPGIKRFFQDYLLVSYSNSSSESLPKKPIVAEEELQQDCIWEYKPLQGLEWQTFAIDEAGKLHQALSAIKTITDPIQVKTPQGLFNVSMTTFLGTNANDSKSPEKQAWIRCRGSSVLNFHIEGLWQLMFVRYPKGKAKPSSLPTASDFTTNLNSDFDVELNIWYMCDIRTNSLLNNSMNIRRKVITTDIHIDTNEEPMICNLQTFTFVNEDKTALGYLRWIPQLVSNDERKKKSMDEVDSLKSRSDVEDVPLTTDKHAHKKPHDDDKSLDEDDEMGFKANDDYDDDDDDDDMRTRTKKKVCLLFAY